MLLLFPVLVFGYVTCFSVAFCLAPLVALVGMLLKMQSDRYYVCCNTQRPLPRRVSGIGIWLRLLEQMSTLAIVTNVMIIYFTTSQLSFYFPNSSGERQFAMVLLYEHILFGIQYVIGMIIPETPENIKEKMREHEMKLDHMRRKLLKNRLDRDRNMYNRRTSLRVDPSVMIAHNTTPTTSGMSTPSRRPKNRRHEMNQNEIEDVLTSIALN